MLANPLPYPRDAHHPDFLKLSRQLHAIITQAVLPEAPAPAVAPDTRRRPVQSFPTVSLGRVTGLLEVLENEGDMELSDLARQVDLGLTELLLVVKAAELLGWVTTPGQRVAMTDEGRHFLAADINTRRQLLNARLRDLFVFNLMLQMLNASPNHEVDEEAVLSQFALYFPHERPQRILRTLIAWARYAELAKYNATRKVLYGLRQAKTRS